MRPLVSIITVNYNSLEVTCELLDSIRRGSFQDLEVIVVDNASRENPADCLKKHYPEVKFIRSDTNLGFAGGNNLGVRASRGSFLFFLNNDAEITEGAVETMLALFGRFPKAGAVSPKICYHNPAPASEPDVIQYLGATRVHPLTARNTTLFEKEADRGQCTDAKPTAYAHGAAMMVPRQVIEKAGMMSEEFFLYYEELDWCERIRRAGFEIYVEPNAKIYHKESYSVSQTSTLKTYYLNRNRILFMRRNRAEWQVAAFWLFLLFFTIPKNALLHLVRGERAHLRAFFDAIFWNLKQPKNLSPVSTPLTFSTANW